MSSILDVLDLSSDHHVHSTFSDGRGTLEDNIAVAEARGLVELGCVDHVRADTAWVPSYATAVGRARAHTKLTLWCGVEAKILDDRGTLDLPGELPGVDRVYIADHQIPGPRGPLKPWAVRAALVDGTLQPEDFLRHLIGATARSLHLSPVTPVIAHLFSVLPKVGLSEDDVDIRWLAPLIEAALATGAAMELDERWTCPGETVARTFSEAGVPLLASSDSHRPETIGQYPWLSTLGSEPCTA
jgi:putative hydrolase